MDTALKDASPDVAIGYIVTPLAGLGPRLLAQAGAFTGMGIRIEDATELLGHTPELSDVPGLTAIATARRAVVVIHWASADPEEILSALIKRGGRCIIVYLPEVEAIMQASMREGADGGIAPDRRRAEAIVRGWAGAALVEGGIEVVRHEDHISDAIAAMSTSPSLAKPWPTIRVEIPDGGEFVVPYDPDVWEGTPTRLAGDEAISVIYPGGVIIGDGERFTIDEIAEQAGLTKAGAGEGNA